MKALEIYNKLTDEKRLAIDRNLLRMSGSLHVWMNFRGGFRHGDSPLTHVLEYASTIKNILEIEGFRLARKGKEFARNDDGTLKITETEKGMLIEWSDEK
jgi:hypothetical protein